MGKKSKAPPPPDYTPIAQASQRQAELSFELGREQLEWAKKAHAEDRELTERVTGEFLRFMEETERQATADRERYESVFQPLEDDLVREAGEFSSGARRDLEMGRAQTQVSDQFAVAREAAQRELESFGVNPSATRFAALDVGLRAQEAAAVASAGTEAGLAVDDRGRALRTEAINIGRGYPGQIAQSYGTAVGAGQGAIGGQLDTTRTGGQTMGTAPQFMGAGNQALNIWGNALTQGHEAALGTFNANQNRSSGIGSALGLIGGIGLKRFGFKRGGKVPYRYEDGGAVPVAASPSRGAIPDDIPAQLDAGEFVIPREAVDWHGEKHFHKLIEGARREREEAVQRSGAVPTALPVGA